MYSYRSINDNNENIEQHLSQEYSSSQSYHEMQAVSFESQSTTNMNHQDASSLPVCDSRSDNHRHANQPLSSLLNSTIRNNNNYVAPVTSTELPAKKRRTTAGPLVAPSTAPLPRKRFNPTVESTAASAMRNSIGGETTVSSRVVNAATKSISETAQNGLNQTIKPLMKLCEETNQLIKEMLQKVTEQTRLINELVTFPRELQKTTERLSHIVHMQARVTQIRQQNDDDDLIIELNGISLGNITRGNSLNQTARNIIRAAYGETASYNDMAPGEFDILLDFIARLHGLPAAIVFANSQSIKNSLQQMKHDNKKSSSTKSSITVTKRRTSTTIERQSIPHDDSENDDDEL